MLFGRRPGKAERWKCIVDQHVSVLEEQAGKLRDETARLLQQASEAAKQQQRPMSDVSRLSQRLSDASRMSEIVEFDDSMFDFVQRLLEPEPHKRLGANSISELKQHPFFQGLDFQELLAKKLQPPFLPDITKANCETNSEDFLDCIAIEEHAPVDKDPLPMELQAKFEGYEYNTAIDD